MPSPEDEDPEIDPVYLALYTETVEEFRAHLSGKTKDEPLLASYFPPHAYWTEAEKDTFFHALTVHSRLRPDLIAQEVKTKTVSDVCVYITMLAEADASLRKSKTATAPFSREDFPSAAEAPDDWIAFEEHTAASMISLQPVLDLEDTLQEREDVVQAQRATIRAPKLGGRTPSGARDRAGEDARREDFERWEVQQRAEWEGEDLLRSLDKMGLTALDRILREDEEGRTDIPAVNSLSGIGPSAVLWKMEVDEPLTAPVEEVVAPVPTIDDGLIDPMLLELSQPVSAAPILTSTFPPAQMIGVPDSSLQSVPGPLHPLTAPSEPLIPPLAPAVTNPTSQALLSSFIPSPL